MTHLIFSSISLSSSLSLSAVHTPSFVPLFRQFAGTAVVRTPDAGAVAGAFVPSLLRVQPVQPSQRRAELTPFSSAAGRRRSSIRCVQPPTPPFTAPNRCLPCCSPMRGLISVRRPAAPPLLRQYSCRCCCDKSRGLSPLLRRCNSPSSQLLSVMSSRGCCCPPLLFDSPKVGYCLHLCRVTR